jgi:hypothetical protein
MRDPQRVEEIIKAIQKADTSTIQVPPQRSYSIRIVSIILWVPHPSVLIYSERFA